MVIAWKEAFSHISKTPSCIGSQLLWFQLQKSALQTQRDLKHFKDFKREFCLHDNLQYKWLQLARALPRKLKDILKQNIDICQDLILLNYHLIKINIVLSLENLVSKELCNIIVLSTKSILT